MTSPAIQTKVFIGGSRRLSRLNNDVKSRIQNIVDKGFTIIIGDANGIDKAVQCYLSEKNYNNVVVFFMEDGCRNNVRGWSTRRITAALPTRRDFAFYSTKDRAMTKEADYGLMLWDGQSRGTLTNIIHLLREGKPVVVYIAREKAFYTLRRSTQLTKILSSADPASRRQLALELGTDSPNESDPLDSPSLF